MAKVDLNDIPQGASSGMDSDTIDGLQTSSYSKPSPNTLVPLGPEGKLPASAIPSNAQIDMDFTLLETQNPSSSTGFTFSEALVADQRYLVTYALVQGSATGNTEVRFNGDSGANYDFAQNGLNSTGSGTSDNANASTSARLTVGVSSGTYLFGSFQFSTVPGDDTRVLATTNVASNSGGAAHLHGGFHWNGSSTLSSLSIVINGGTTTGTFKLYKIS